MVGIAAWLRSLGKNSGIDLRGAQRAVQGEGNGSSGYSGPIEDADEAEPVQRPARESKPAENVSRAGNAGGTQSRAQETASLMSESSQEEETRAAQSVRSSGAPVKTTARSRGTGTVKTPANAGTEPKAVTRKTSTSKACPTKGRPAGYKRPPLTERCVTYEDRRTGRTVEAHVCDFLVTSSKNGKAITATLSYFAAYDFMLMAAAFRKEMGQTLQIRGPDSHFRTFEQQERQFLKNYTKNSKGQWVRHGVTVANPYTNTSNHQRGLALDIEVGRMPKDSRGDGQPFANPTEIYKWLEKNAPLYGFTNTEGKKAGVREPWHWGHPGDKLYGIEKKPVSNPVADRAEQLAVAASEGPGRANVSADASRTAARVRANSAAGASRISMAANATGANLAAADYARRQALAAKLQAEIREPPSYKVTRETLFDYKTGKWGDGSGV